ncbi:hypothetical protein MAJ_04561, partial [Metarhizium majus ARSEF 297]
MSPSAEPCRLSGHHGEPSAPTAQENQLGMFEKSLREKVHNQWERLCVPTAKCDKCQTQSHKVLLKCSVCGWDICQKCSGKIDGLRKSEGPCHILDHNAVDWEPEKKDSTNSQKKRTNAKKNTTHAKKTTTRRAKRVKTANKVEITLVPVTEELHASGISGHAKGQILPHPLQGKAHKAIQAMPAIYLPHRYPESIVDDEHEIVAGMPTQRQNSNSPYPDRQENPSTMKGFVPAQILLPNPSTYPHLPSMPPFSSGHSLPLQYTTTMGRAAHGLPREPWPFHTKLRQPLAIRHRSPESVQIWIPPFENRIGYGKQTCPEPGPPRPYETQYQEYHETKPILGKRGRSTFTLLEPEVNLGEPYLSRALPLCGDTK